MSNEAEYISNLNFPEKIYSEVVRIANELAGLENRKPHDSIRVLIEEAGQEKIERLEKEKGG